MRGGRLSVDQRLVGLPRLKSQLCHLQLCGPMPRGPHVSCPCDAAWAGPAPLVPGHARGFRPDSSSQHPGHRAWWGCSQDSTHLPGHLLVGHRETHDGGVGVEQVPGVHVVGVAQVLRLLPAVQLRVLPLRGRLGGWRQPHERGQSWPGSGIWPTGRGTLYSPSSRPSRSPARCLSSPQSPDSEEQPPTHPGRGRPRPSQSRCLAGSSRPSAALWLSGPPARRSHTASGQRLPAQATPVAAAPRRPGSQQSSARIPTAPQVGGQAGGGRGGDESLLLRPAPMWCRAVQCAGAQPGGSGGIFQREKEVLFP